MKQASKRHFDKNADLMRPYLMTTFAVNVNANPGMVLSMKHR